MKPIIKNDDLKREREDFTARLNEQIDEPPKGIFSNLDDHKFSSKNFPARMAVPLFHKKVDILNELEYLDASLMERLNLALEGGTKAFHRLQVQLQ